MKYYLVIGTFLIICSAFSSVARADCCLGSPGDILCLDYIDSSFHKYSCSGDTIGVTTTGDPICTKCKTQLGVLAIVLIVVGCVVVLFSILFSIYRRKQIQKAQALKKTKRPVVKQTSQYQPVPSYQQTPPESYQQTPNV